VSKVAAQTKPASRLAHSCFKKPSTLSSQAAFVESWRPHSQVQAGFPRSPAGGNTW
jgi:hypothetical protein